MRQKTKPGKAVLRLWSDVRGVAALEFAFVVPFLVIIFAGIVQFGAIFFIQNNMATAAREVSRSLSVGTIETAAEAESLANDRLVNWGISFNVNTTIPDPDDPNDTDYTVVITAPLSDAAIFDILGVFQSGSLRAQASMREEG
jgi:Flp pilus assembly protein TadG